MIVTDLNFRPPDLAREIGWVDENEMSRNRLQGEARKS
jgi:hypothetical protein